MTGNEHFPNPADLKAHYTRRVNAAAAAGLIDLIDDLNVEYTREMAKLRKRTRRCG